LQKQQDQFDAEVANAISRAGVATAEARTLSLQATSLRSGLEEQLRCKSEEVAKLQAEVEELTTQIKDAHIKDVDDQFAQLKTMDYMLKQRYTKLKGEIEKLQSEKRIAFKAFGKLVKKLARKLNWDISGAVEMIKTVDMTTMTDENVSKFYQVIP
uniref:LZ3wCH domain-containing protein n=1 Tax=Echinostoma caproni TaxID=27848 RepID=A0A183ARH3_9TREM